MGITGVRTLKLMRITLCISFNAFPQFFHRVGKNTIKILKTPDFLHKPGFSCELNKVTFSDV